MTREYPPEVYGGAGVHVDYLSRELAKLIPVEVRTFGEQDVRDGNLVVRGFRAAGPHPSAGPVSAALAPFAPALEALRVSVEFTAEAIQADVVHCHTWYAHLGGVLARLCYTEVGGIPEVVVHGETGFLVPVESHPGPEFEPREPARFSHDLAAHVNLLLEDAGLRRAMGAKGRQRVEALFSWRRVAAEVVLLYRSLSGPERHGG